MLNRVLIASDTDGDGNLLIDSWEKCFFGHTGVDPFADATGDGYSNLQKMLDGSDPNDFYGRPVGPPVTFHPPVLVFQTAGGQVELHFLWPAAYIGKFIFGVRHGGFDPAVHRTGGVCAHFDRGRRIQDHLRNARDLPALLLRHNHASVGSFCRKRAATSCRSFPLASTRRRTR